MINLKNNKTNMPIIMPPYSGYINISKFPARRINLVSLTWIVSSLNGTLCRRLSGEINEFNLYNWYVIVIVRKSKTNVLAPLSSWIPAA